MTLGLSNLLVDFIRKLFFFRFLFGLDNFDDRWTYTGMNGLMSAIAKREFLRGITTAKHELFSRLSLDDVADMTALLYCGNFRHDSFSLLA
jgi:hypothetical protein